MPGSTSRAPAWPARLVADGVVKGDRVGLLVPNGDRLGGHALAVMRDRRGPRAAEHLAAAARTAGPAHDGVGHRTSSLCRSSAAAATSTTSRRRRRGCRRPSGAGGRHPAAPSLRRLWTPDALPDAAAPLRLVARPRSTRAAGRRPGRALHLGQPRGAEGRHPHPRRRRPGDGGRPGGPVRGPRRAALHPHAVLLDGRLRRRAAHRARRGCHLAHRSGARADPHARAARARARHALPGLAGPGRASPATLPSPLPTSRRSATPALLPFSRRSGGRRPGARPTSSA